MKYHVDKTYTLGFLNLNYTLQIWLLMVRLCAKSEHKLPAVEINFDN